MEIIAIPLLLLFFVYRIFIEVQKNSSIFRVLLFVLPVVFITAFAVYFFATVRANYSGQAEWIQERRFFLQLFIEKLESSGDLQTAAQYMRSPEVREKTLDVIQKIVCAFSPKTIIFLLTGGIILLLSAATLWFKRIRNIKFYPYMFLCVLVIGTGIFDVGVWYFQYARETKIRLYNFLRLQQDFTMKDLSELKTNLSIPEIITITRKEAADKNGYNHGQRLPDLLRTKDKPLRHR